MAAGQGAASDGCAARVRLRGLGRCRAPAVARAAPAGGAAGAADRLSAGAGAAAGLGGDADAAEGRRARAARVHAGRVVAVLGCADRVLLVRDDDRLVSGGACACVRVVGGRAARVRVRDNLRSVVARGERNEVVWNQRFLYLRGHYAFHPHACTPATPREKGSVEAVVRYLKTGFWP